MTGCKVCGDKVNGKSQYCEGCKITRKRELSRIRQKIYRARHPEANNTEAQRRATLKWQQKNRGKVNATQKRYVQRNRDNLNTKTRAWREKNKDLQTQLTKNWRKANPDKVKEMRRRYYLKHKDQNLLRGKEWAKKNPDKDKAIHRKFRTTPKGKASNKQHKARRRSLGFIEMNECFEGSEAHHINKDQIIYIPQDMHKKHPHNLNDAESMELINKLAFEFIIWGQGIEKTHSEEREG